LGSALERGKQITLAVAANYNWDANNASHRNHQNIGIKAEGMCNAYTIDA
jgi:hypothetical protein